MQVLSSQHSMTPYFATAFVTTETIAAILIGNHGNHATTVCRQCASERHFKAGLAGFVADSLVYGPGYSFTVKNPSGGTLMWHEAAQAWLMSLGANPANASLLYSLAAPLFCWVLLWLLWRKRIFFKV
jgi:hypothetical protein